MKRNNFFAQLPFSWAFASAWVLAFVLAALLPFQARGVTLEHFGFGFMKINDKLPLGTRPLLVIVANYAGNPALASRDWESLIFTGATSLTEYYREVSNGRFFWTNPGILQVNFSEAERASITTREQIIAEVVQRKGVDLRDFDTNQDRVVTGDELCILIIHNLVDGDAQTGWVNLVMPSPSSPPLFFITVNLGASNAAHTQSLMTLCHEICHTLGAKDLYGNNVDLHNGITIMDGNSAANSNLESYHLDPWHKMALGWCEPRIVSLRGNGDAIIPAAQLAAQLGRADAPVLLFDPLRGPAEFYLLEYRTNNTSAGAGFDADVTQQGLLIWHVWQNPDHTPVLTSPHTTLPFPSQTGWTYCKKCNGNFYRPGQGSSRCPKDGGNHEPYDSHNYSMVWNSPTAPGQHDWLWCQKCQSMFFGGNALPTRCPADNGSHDGSQSANYVLRFASEPLNDGQPGWLWCSKCQALFAGDRDGNKNLITVAGVCPVSGKHDGQSSAEYRLHYDNHDVFNEAAGNVSEMTLGMTTAWNIGDTTPYSRWFSDTSEVRVRYQPKRYLNGGDELLVEWISELPPPAYSGETWVDYNGPFPSGDGSFLSPFKSLRQAVDASPFYRRIKIKPGWGSERLTIRQSVVLEAPLGSVTIGP